MCGSTYEFKLNSSDDIIFLIWVALSDKSEYRAQLLLGIFLTSDPLGQGVRSDDKSDFQLGVLPYVKAPEESLIDEIATLIP